MIKRYFIIFFVIIFICSLFSVVAFASVSYGNIDATYVKDSLSSTPYVDLLDGSTYTITKTYTNGDVQVIENAAEPLVKDYDGVSTVKISWDVAYSNYNNLNFFLSAGTYSFKLDGTSVNFSSGGNYGTIRSRVYSTARTFSNIEVTFSSFDRVVCIYSGFANINNNIGLSMFYYQSWINFGYFDDGNVGEVVREEDAFTANTETHDVIFYSTSNTSETWLNWERTRLTINPVDFESYSVNTLSFQIFCSGEKPDITAFICNTEQQDPEYYIHPGYSGLNVSVIPYGTIPGSAIDFDGDFIDDLTYNCYTVSIDLTGVKLLEKFIIIDIQTYPFIFDTERRHTFLGVSIPLYYSIPIDQSSSFNSHLLSLLERILATDQSIEEEVSDVRQLLNLVYTFLTDSDLASLLSEILVALESHFDDFDQLVEDLNTFIASLDSLPDDLQSIITQLSSVNSHLANIEAWLGDFSLDDDPIVDDLGYLENSKDTIKDLIDELDRTPKTDRETMVEQIERGDQVIQNYIPENWDDDPTFITPLTVTTPLATLYSGSLTSSFISQVLLLVVAIALVGFVLFGKR